MADGAGPPRLVLRLIERLCGQLAAEGIAYCHWKSNAAIDRSASGDNDLDLLVERADAQRFTEVLDRVGFKEARLPAERELPGIRDFYGYDRDADRWVHVHAHYQLVLGHDASKNYHLPLEEPYVRSAVMGTLFKVPAPEFELVVFVIRMMLKHATWDALLGLEGRLSSGERRELEYLMAKADRESVERLVAQHLPYVGIGTFDGGMQALSPGASLWSRWRAGRRLLRSLQAHGRRPPLTDAYLRIRNRAVWGFKRYVIRRRTRKSLATGGLLVAIVGGDGAGKSTVVEEVVRWLSAVFHVKRVHMGKPPRSLPGLAAKAALKLVRVLSGAQAAGGATGEGPRAFPGYAWLAWHVLTARDRYRAYTKARRLATNGAIVICDRYPLFEVKSMDGPRTAGAAARGRPWLERLVRLEESYYDHIRAPDLLVVLKVDPEIAVTRRSDEDAEWIRNRSKEVWELDWAAKGATVVDAGRPKAEVLGQVKSLVWSRL